MTKRIKFITIILSSAVILLFSNCEGIGNKTLPDDIRGEWTEATSYYSLTFEFTKNHVYYHDYASNTGVGYDWDDKVEEVFDNESFMAGSDYYYYHIDGYSLNLIKDDVPLTLSDGWWDDNTIAQYRLIKK